MYKKIISLLLVFIMIIGTFQTSFALPAVQGGNQSLQDNLEKFPDLFAAKADGDIARQFVVDAPHAEEYCTENAVTVREFGKNEVMTNGVIDPFFAGGGTMFAPVNKDTIKIYVIAADFNDLPGDVYVPYGIHRNVFTSNNSVYDLSDPDIYYTSIFYGSDGLMFNNKFTWNGTGSNQYKGLVELVEAMSMGRCKVEVECLNERLAVEQGLDPENDKWPWFHIDGPMLEYTLQGPADCEDYRQFGRIHQAGIDAAYRDISDLDIEDIDFIYTILPMTAFGHRAGLQGGGGMETSFSYQDQAMLQRDSQFRHEPGVKTKGGRVVGSGVFGVKGLWGQGANGNYTASAPRTAVRTTAHEFGHGMGLFDDYSYGWMGTNNGESTSSGAGNWGVMSSMTTNSPDLPAWRKYRMGWIDDDEIITILPGETKTFNIRALGSYPGDGGSYIDDPNIETRMVLIPKEFRTRDTFGINWNNGWNPYKTNYNWYDWFTNPWLGGETNAIKSFPTFYALECRKTLGADGMPKGQDTGLAASSQGMVVSYIANPTWETGHGAGGFKVMTGNNGLRVGGTASWTDVNIGLTVTVNSSNDFYDNVTVTYTGLPAGTSAAKHVYLGMLNASDNFVTANQSFDVDFNLTTLGGPTRNDSTGTPENATRVGTPLAVPGGISGFTMSVEFDADNLEYVSAGTAPFTYNVDTTDAAGGKLVVTGTGSKMVDKDSILSLQFKTKEGAASGEYTIKGTIADVKLIDYGGRTLVAGDPGFDGVGTVGDGTFAAFHTNNSNNLSSNDIKSTGGKVTVGPVHTYTLSGKITCGTPGPVSGTFIGVESVVDLYNSAGIMIASTKSDWNGNYSIKGVPAGSGYYLRANKPKYVEGSTAVFDVSTNTTVEKLKLDRETFTVSGTIYGSANSDGSGAVPLAGAEVYIVSIGNAYRILGGPAITNADGTYSVQASTDSMDKPFAAVAVKADGYGTQLHLDNLKLNLGMLYGIDPSDRVYPGNSATYGVGGGYNFMLNGNVSNRNVTLTTTQDVHLRTATKSTEHVYQLRDMDGNAIGSPVNSVGTANGDDLIRNVAPGQYYIEVSRPGYISACTRPFSVDTTRVFLRNAFTSNTLDLVAAGSGNTVSGTVINAATGEPVDDVRIQYVNSNGMGGIQTSSESGEFTYLCLNGAKQMTFWKDGFVSKTITIPTGNQSSLSIELLPIHSVTFMDWDGTVLNEQKVIHSEAAISPDDPVREGWFFIGWNVDFSEVSEDLAVTAQYKTTSATASIEKLIGNTNNLTITVTELYSDGSNIIFVEMFSINDNAAGTYVVDCYEVYVDTKGNDQIRACYIVRTIEDMDELNEDAGELNEDMDYPDENMDAPDVDDLTGQQTE
ncbi:hypothetical protein [Sedimentibacter sp.]|uniref:hypothetical protein n=1 Tax=Sedimentibacter sp. TaxID=1960295 RepID=UPI0028AFC72A|nr:hypothetical protein [Sedimentibacter sp.]